MMIHFGVFSGELLKEFFEFYSDFDFENNAVSLVNSSVFPVATIEGVDHPAMYVQNPLEHELNVCKNVTNGEVDKFRKTCSRAQKSLEDDASAKHRTWGLLKIFGAEDELMKRLNVNIQQIFNAGDTGEEKVKDGSSDSKVVQNKEKNKAVKDLSTFRRGKWLREEDLYTQSESMIEEIAIKDRQSESDEREENEQLIETNHTDGGESKQSTVVDQQVNKAKRQTVKTSMTTERKTTTGDDKDRKQQLEEYDKLSRFGLNVQTKHQKQTQDNDSSMPETLIKTNS